MSFPSANQQMCQSGNVAASRHLAGQLTRIKRTVNTAVSRLRAHALHVVAVRALAHEAPLLQAGAAQQARSSASEDPLKQYVMITLIRGHRLADREGLSDRQYPAWHSTTRARAQSHDRGRTRRRPRPATGQARRLLAVHRGRRAWVAGEARISASRLRKPWSQTTPSCASTGAVKPSGRIMLRRSHKTRNRTASVPIAATW